MRQGIRARKRYCGLTAHHVAAVLILLCIMAVLMMGGKLTNTRLRAVDSVDDGYNSAAAALLLRRLDASGPSYLLLDARTREIVVARWTDRNRYVPVGSLVKPFTALAYARGHRFRYPEFVCHGRSSGCWLPRGHGQLDLELAIAYSCNAYFRNLAATVDSADTASVLRHFALDREENTFEGLALVGLGSNWRVRPEDLLRAYCQLSVERNDPGVDKIIRGMMLSARVGTASSIHMKVPSLPSGLGSAKDLAERSASTRLRPVTLEGDSLPAILAKTGTAPCAHPRGGQGDGYVIALWPAESPRFALLVQAHEQTGAEAAIAAGEIIRMVAKGE